MKERSSGGELAKDSSIIRNNSDGTEKPSVPET
jgi:hypothetical protein